MKPSEDTIINQLDLDTANYYSPGSKLNIPTSESFASVIKKICQLARAKKSEELNVLYKTYDTRLVEHWAVVVLAWAGDDAAVNLLIQKFSADRDWATKGYAWGGHVPVSERVGFQPRIYLLLEGFALGRHTTEVNRLLETEEETHLTSYALQGYIKGEHVNNEESTLELITLTSNKVLKERLALALKEKIPLLDVALFLKKAQKIDLLISEVQNDNSYFQQALTILNETELSEHSPKTAQNTSPAGTYLGMFKAIAEKNFSYYQLKAVKQCFGVTENIMLNWRPTPNNRSENRLFSECHLRMLKHLLSENNYSPSNAIQEINELNLYEVMALNELFGRGLRGQHLRDRQKTEFNEKILEELLKKCADVTIEPIAALDELLNQKPSKRALMATIVS